MRLALWIIGFVLWCAAVSAGIVVVERAFFGATKSVWIGATSGVAIGFVTLLVMWAERRGWITIWPRRNRIVEARRQGLWEQRESILAEARASATGPTGSTH